MRGAFFFPLDTSVWYSVSQLKNGEFTNKRESFRCGSIDFRCNRAPVATKWNVLPEYKYIYLHIHAYIVMYAWTNTWALNTMAEDLRSQFFFFFFLNNNDNRPYNSRSLEKINCFRHRVERHVCTRVWTLGCRIRKWHCHSHWEKRMPKINIYFFFFENILEI